MIRTLYSLVFAIALASSLVAALSCTGPTAALAQETEPPVALSLDVTIETSDGETITLPLRIDDATFAALADLAPAVEVMDVMNQLIGRELVTITVVAPAVFTPVATVLLIEPVELPVPPVAVAAPVTTEVTATETTTVAVEVPPVTEAAPTLVTAAANLRAAPTVEANVLGQISADTPITITGRNSDGSWFRLDDGAWVVGFVVQDAPTGLPIVAEGEQTIAQTIPATVTGGTIVLRAGPSLTDDSLGAYEAGTVTAIISRAPDGGWLEVLVPDGKIGWMSAEFLTVADALEGLPTVITSERLAITGRVVDASGEGIGDIVISAMPTGGRTVPRVEATTASDGEFTLYMTPGGATEWTVRIAGVGCDSRIVNSRCQLFGYFSAVPEADVSLPTTETVTLVYEDATSFIAGTVVDAGGEPVGNNIRVSGEREDGARTSGLTSSTGKFVLPAAAGLWTVATENGPSIEVEVPEKSAPEPVDLPLE